MARVLIGKDITELRRSRTRYEAIVESQVEFVIRRTPDGAITFVYCAGEPRVSRARRAHPLGDTQSFSEQEIEVANP